MTVIQHLKLFSTQPALPPYASPLKAWRQSLHGSSHPFHPCNKGSIRPMSVRQGGKDPCGHMQGWELDRDRIKHKPGILLKERIHNLFVLFDFQRARAVHQYTVCAHHARCMGKEGALQFCHPRDIFLLPSPPQVRPLGQHSCPRARRIYQHLVIRNGGDGKGKKVRGHGGHHLVHPLDLCSMDQCAQFLRGHVHCGQQSLSFQPTCRKQCFSSWRGACIQHPISRYGVYGSHCQGCRFILHGAPTLAHGPCFQ
mmetsp:Transcript_4701/g.29653  ORF Transcript_4701/g.29653 Transcript_4701/m.29653 type:complete len:254 (+) Transcript_4701:1185-1946(+)